MIRALQIQLEHICKEDIQNWQKGFKCGGYARPLGNLLFSSTVTNLLPIFTNNYDIKKKKDRRNSVSPKFMKT